MYFTDTPFLNSVAASMRMTSRGIHSAIQKGWEQSHSENAHKGLASLAILKKKQGITELSD